MTKAKKKTKAVKVERIEKAELFAYAYIRNMGNGAAAAREVYGMKDEAARSQASRMLTNVDVQKIIGEFLDGQRESLKKFTEQNNQLFTLAAQNLIQIMTDINEGVKDRLDATDKLLRLAGFEISEQVATAKANARGVAAAGRAQLPGLAAPGVQPGQPQGNIDNSRKVIFMLSPPPMPAGGTPPPALLEQWKELGWKPSEHNLAQ